MLTMSRVIGPSLTANLLLNANANPLVCRKCGEFVLSTSVRANMSTAVRVRFAPSPTGDLHLGGLRTALYNYLFARKNDGRFILRCEDTDQARLVPGALDKMMESLAWIGITPDEGPGVGGDYGPYKQSERLDLYKDRVERLLNEDHAYRCFCTPQRLDLLRKDQMRRRESFQGYDNNCRNLSTEKINEKLSTNVPYAIRFKLINEVQTWTDLVFGEMSSDLNHVEGDPEWQSSTAKHLQIFTAFGWKPPSYAHLPLLLNTDGTKLSKRQDSLRLESLQGKGYEPESIISLLSLSGGGVSMRHTQINESGVTLSTAIENFSLEKIRPDNSVLDMDRLPVLNQSCLLRMYKADSKEKFCDRITKLCTSRGLQSPNLDKIYERFPTLVDRIPTLSGLFEGDLLFVWQHPDTEAVNRLREMKSVSVEDCVTVVNILKQSASDSQITVDETVQSCLAKTKLKKGAVYKIIRVAISGSEVGAPVAMMLDLLDKAEVCTRCDSALHVLHNPPGV